MKILRRYKFDWFVCLFFVYLAVKAVFFDSLINVVIPPDYNYHVGVSKIYKNNPKIIFFWNKGDVKISCDDLVRYNPPVSTSPFLYHSIVGKVWFLTGSLKITSLIQTIFGLLTVFYVYLLARMISERKIVTYLAMVIAGSLPMFSYEINYLTYDNLVNLAGAASIYYLMIYWKKRKISDLVKLFIFLFVGSLTKITFGPLLIIILFLLAILVNKSIFKVIKNFFGFLFKKKNFWLTFVFLFFLGLTLAFYGRNLIKYRALFPKYSYYLERDCLPK